MCRAKHGKISRLILNWETTAWAPDDNNKLLSVGQSQRDEDWHWIGYYMGRVGIAEADYV